ncbi:MAG TPA: ATP-dependent DNA helicase, partial [Luteimonas sp.]|nr:ATP-dependent DNA helicase [Luteimonas sp.]
SGRTAWARLRGASPADLDGSRVGSLRATPLVLLPRARLATWSALSARDDDGPATLTTRAQRVVDHLAAHGASFFDDLLAGTRLLQTELEDALAECVARGRVHCDSFAGLRALLLPPSKRPATSARQGRRRPLFGIADAGRWSLTRRDAGHVAGHVAGAGAAGAHAGPAAAPDGDALEHVARTLLRRYGVVGWRVLEREAPWLPPWRSLLRTYHRLEARGDVRGGRFIAGLAGEQFALPEAIGALRGMRNRAPTGELVDLSAIDPLNLTGTLLAGPRVPRLAGARVLWRDGIAIAMRVAGTVELLQDLDAGVEQAARHVLQREPYRTPLPPPASALPDTGASSPP